MRVYICIFIAAAVTFILRALPLAILKKPIKNRFLRSFLFYMPYVTLSVMTFPAIIDGFISPVTGIAALVFGVLAAYFGAGLFGTAVITCVAAYAADLVLRLL